MYQQHVYYSVLQLFYFFCAIVAPIETSWYVPSTVAVLWKVCKSVAMSERPASALQNPLFVQQHIYKPDHKMGRPFKQYLNASPGKLYICGTCRCHLSDHDEIVSKVCSRALPRVSIPSILSITSRPILPPCLLLDAARRFKGSVAGRTFSTTCE